MGKKSKRHQAEKAPRPRTERVALEMDPEIFDSAAGAKFLYRHLREKESKETSDQASVIPKPLKFETGREYWKRAFPWKSKEGRHHAR